MFQDKLTINILDVLWSLQYEKSFHFTSCCEIFRIRDGGTGEALVLLAFLIFTNTEKDFSLIHLTCLEITGYTEKFLDGSDELIYR